MTQGPYQSNILRFFVRQYWQGIARHRHAVRQTRAKVTFGVSVGTTFALLPVYAAVRASQVVTAKLKDVVERTSALGTGDPTEAMLGGAVFDSRLAFLERGRDTYKEISQHADERFSEGVLLAERAISMSLALAGSYLSNTQRARLAGQKATLSMRLLSWGKQSLVKISNHMGRPITGNAINFSRSVLSSEVVSQEPALITGIASNVKTRSLVLVLGFNSTWNALTPTQQAQLQRHFRQFLVGNGLNSQDSLLQEGNAGLSLNFSCSQPFWMRYSTYAQKLTQSPIGLNARVPKSSLIRPVNSFWLYVLQYVLQMLFALRQRRQAQASSVLSRFTEKFSLNSSGSLKLSAANLQGALATGPPQGLKANASKIQTSRPSEVEGSLGTEANIPLHSLRCESLSCDGDTAGIWDADVITISYVEHPLERLLKWIDRIFVWLEKQWNVLWSRQIGKH
ncbi:MAG: hypothetical protein AAFQ74_01665 [Cyanobacteria bacterium J06623_4]